MRTWFLVVAACLGSGCATTLSDGHLRSLPQEQRAELMEADIELAMAIDRSDEAKTALAMAVDQPEAARTKPEVEGEGQIRDAQLRYLDLRIAAAERRVSFEAARLECARAGVEHAKAVTAKRAKLPGTEDLDLGSYREDLDRCAKTVKAEERQ